jgi:two-component system, cell cycle sensor histidine kinase and response regulator CckA
MVLVDLMLPEMSGSVVAAEVQKFWPDVRISYMSGYSDAEMIKRGLLNPADRFLQKPFRLETLTSHVQAVLGGAYDPVACVHRPDVCATAAVA